VANCVLSVLNKENDDDDDDDEGLYRGGTDRPTEIGSTV